MAKFRLRERVERATGVELANDHLERGVAHLETMAIVRKCMGMLPESYRVVLVLRDIEGVCTEDVAKALNTSPDAIKVDCITLTRRCAQFFSANHRGRGPGQVCAMLGKSRERFAALSVAQ